ACPGQGKTPEDSFIFIEQNDLTPARPIFESREFERRPCQLSGLGSEPAAGPAVADVFFSRVAKSAGVSSPPASRDRMRDHGESAGEGFVADAGSPVPAAALARH